MATFRPKNSARKTYFPARMMKNNIQFLVNLQKSVDLLKSVYYFTEFRKFTKICKIKIEEWNFRLEYYCSARSNELCNGILNCQREI